MSLETNPNSLSAPPCMIGNVTDTLISDTGVTTPQQLLKYSDYIKNTFLSQCTDTQVQSPKAQMQIIIIIVKSFYSLWSIGHPRRASRHYDFQLFPWLHSMIFLFLLFHPLLSFATFSSAYLFFCIPEDSNLMLFSLLLLLCIMCVRSNSNFFFLSDFLLASVG
jgi:hypothetical protein